MTISSIELNNILTQFDEYMQREISIIAVGGTALTLLGIKQSTKDVDFCFLSENDMKRFIQIAEKISYMADGNKLKKDKIVIDLYSEGYIFCVQLENEYAKKAIPIREMKKIKLFSLAPIDIIVTKTARLNERDIEDISTLFESFEIDKEELVFLFIASMEKSIVKNAKLNLIWLADKFDFPEQLKKEINGWEYA
jgi:hypothetical protein